MFWNYLKDTALATSRTFTKVYYFMRGTFFALFAVFVALVAAFAAKGGLQIALSVCLAVYATAFATYVVTVNLTSRPKAVSTSIITADIVRAVTALAVTVISTAISILAVDDKTSAVNVVFLIGSIAALIIVYSREVIFTLIKYLKYKTKKNVKKFVSEMKTDLFIGTDKKMNISDGHDDL